MATWDNSYPLANPLNKRQYGKSLFRSVSNSQKLEPPNQDIPFYSSDEFRKRNAELTVPSQDIPLGDQLKGAGFIPGSDNIFRLSDGTIVDFKLRKIIKTPSININGYWGNPYKIISMPYQAVHDDNGPTIENMLANFDSRKNNDLNLDIVLDPQSAAYWLKAEEEAEKLKSSMSDEQRRMIDDFEQHFPKSRLIEESKKQRN